MCNANGQTSRQTSRQIFAHLKESLSFTHLHPVSQKGHSRLAHNFAKC